jgi:hypothetical protein
MPGLRCAKGRLSFRKEVLQAGNGFAIRPKLTVLDEIPHLVGLVGANPISTTLYKTKGRSRLTIHKRLSAFCA